MGRRLRKKELLNEIQRERRALDDALALLSPRQMTQPGVTRGGWSVKDVLAHLVEWQRIYRKHHRRSLHAVMGDYQSFHERVVELIDASDSPGRARPGR